MGLGLLLRCRRALPLAGLAVALAGAAPVQAAPMQADLDRDGVFDSLEGRAAKIPAGRELRVVVTLDADATRGRAAELERHISSFHVKRRFAVVDAVSATVEAGDLRGLAAAPGVVHVEEDARVHVTNASAQQWFGVSEARIDLPSLDGDRDGLPGSYSPSDLVAAVIDTGIDASHVALDGGKVLAFQDFTDGSHTDSDAAIDDHGHGTHVAGTIAGDAASGSGRGVAPAAGLVGLKVLGANGSGYSSDVIAAIDWVWKDPDGTGPAVPNGVTYGIEAINLSLGGTSCSDGADAESQAVNKATLAGYVVAVAAGNSGQGCTASAGISSPAAAEQAITVGAMADVGVGGFYLAGFSSRGPTLDGRVKPDIAAPGVSISSAMANTATGYSVSSGTSMAAPFVAGVALLMRDLEPLLTPKQIKDKMMATALDWGPTGADNDHGAGRLDGYAAIAAAAGTSSSALTTPPSVPAHHRVQSSLAGGKGATRSFKITATGGVPLAVGLTVGDSATDFDMYLYDAAGLELKKAETPQRQDELHLSPAIAGTYTLKVVSWEGSGPFFLDVSGAGAVEAVSIPAPVNTARPTVGGSAAVGAVLTGDSGTWTGDPTLAHEWQTCSAALTDCTSTGDQDTTYTVAAGDAGRSIRLAVTATNAGGAVTAYSDATLVPTQELPLSGDTPAEVPADPAPSVAPPQVEGPNADVSAPEPVDAPTPAPPTPAPPAGGTPALAGIARHGEVLRLAPGQWSGTAPIVFAYSWLRCAPDGERCELLPDSVAERYVLTASDVGSRIVGRVVASNGDGRATADTVPSAVVIPARAATRERPSITGRASRGGALRARGGEWWVAPTVSFRIEWLRCSASGRRCREIESARRSAYLPSRADIGHRLRVRVIATTPAGARVAVSAATAVVDSLSENAALPRGAGRMRFRLADEPTAPARLVTVRLTRR